MDTSSRSQPVPSTRALSMISTGMFWNPARMISTKKGVHCQTMRMMIVKREYTPKKSIGAT